MVKAPAPGSLAEEKNARQFLRIRVKDRTLDFVPNISMREKFALRSATTLPIEAFLPNSEVGFGSDSLFVLWWLARRQNGETNLPFFQAEAEWPEDLTEKDLDLSIVDLDDEEIDSPESSGPSSSSSGPTSLPSSGSDLGSTSSSPNGSLTSTSAT